MPDYRGLLGNRVKSSKGSELSISCPLPTHGGKDVHPSMTVSSETGDWYCHKEGIGGRWPRLAKMLGLSERSDGRQRPQRPDSDVAEFSRKTPAIVPEVRKGKAFPKKRSWRGVHWKTVRLFDCVLVEHKGRTKLKIPLIVGGKEVNHQLAELEKFHGRLSYLTGTGRLSGLMGAQAACRMLSRKDVPRVLILCEGARDAMFCSQNGFAAVALLGASHWNGEKMSQWLAVCDDHGALPATMMDGDEAGRKCADAVRRDMERIGRTVAAVELPDGEDPASLPEEMWKQVHKALAKQAKRKRKE